MKGPVTVKTRNELPDTIFGARHVALREFNPEELEKIASRPQKIVKLPDDISESRRKRMANLAQYKGRSKEGQIKALGNLPRLMKPEPIPPVVPLAPGLTPAEPPRAIMKTVPEKTFRDTYRKVVLSRDENDLYESTWNEWMTAHPEYDNPDDRDEVKTICMSEVLMFRCQLLKRNKPTAEIEEEYNRNFNRKEIAKNNLSNRRRDRKADKQHSMGKNTVINVAVLSGGIPNSMLKEKHERALADKSMEEDMLNRTIKQVESKVIISTPSQPNEDDVI